MKIAGLQKNSFVDYRGKLAAVVFTAGCNLNCYYCHNRPIIDRDYGGKLYSQDDVLLLLKERRRFLDGVVVSGGEPTLQPDLEEFMQKVKELGYPLKLDTNGTNPHVLKRLIGLKLADYIAMDIKAPLHRYNEICGTAVNTRKIEESISLLMEGRVEYEFRTTAAPELSQADVLEIARMIRGADLYVLQQFKRPPAEDVVDYRLLKTPHKPSFIEETAACVKGLVKQYEKRGIV